MLGPVKLLAPFAKLTAHCDPGDRRRLALRSIGLATLTILAASFLGNTMLGKWHVSPGALAIAGGILFFLVAISYVMDAYVEKPAVETQSAEPPGPMVLVRRLLPLIVTPYGIAAVILVLALTPSATGLVVAMLLGIMALDLVAMLVARPAMRVLAYPLQIVGTVMGVLQVALAIQTVVYGVHLVAVQTFGFHAP